MGLITGQGIFSMLADGSNRSMVVADPKVTAFAAAPDGQVIAYADADTSTIYVTSVSGTTPRATAVTTTYGASIESLAWSPDSSRLAYDYCVSEVCGVAISDLAGGLSQVWAPNSGRLSPSGGIAWGSQGLVAAMSGIGCSPCGGGLYSLGADGSNPQSLLSATATTHYESPSISPDGATITYVQWTSGQGPDVASLDTATGSQVQRFRDVTDPAWSPDGVALAYTDGYQIFEGEARGGGSELLTSLPYYGISDLSWIPFSALPPGGCTVALGFGATEGISADATGQGYWVADAYGTVSACGDAEERGGMAGAALNQPVVGIAPTVDRGGYWLAAYDGGVFSFGDAASLPLAGSPGRISLSGMKLSAPIYGIASDPVRAGFWLVATDGGVFTFGKASFFGSAGGLRLAAPVVGMAATPDGGGYWLLGRDGGVFTYGDAPFAGGGVGRLSAPAVAIVSCPGTGYWIIEADGTTLAFGGAPSLGKAALSSRAVFAAATPTGAGMWVVDADGVVAHLGDASAVASPA